MNEIEGWYEEDNPSDSDVEALNNQLEGIFLAELKSAKKLKKMNTEAFE